MSEQDVEVISEGLDAFNRGDRESLGRLLAPDLEWHTLAGPLVGVVTVRGRDAMLKFVFEDVPEEIEGFRASSEEFTDLGNHRVLVVGRFEGRGRASDAEVSMRVASIYEIRDRMIASVRDHSSKDEALEAAGRWE
jgi:ketosteroid isomerase-like protein